MNSPPPKPTAIDGVPLPIRMDMSEVAQGIFAYIEIDDSITHASGYCRQQLHAEPVYGEKNRMTNARAQQTVADWQKCGFNPFEPMSYADYLKNSLVVTEQCEGSLTEGLAELQAFARAAPVAPFALCSGLTLPK